MLRRTGASCVGPPLDLIHQPRGRWLLIEDLSETLRVPVRIGTEDGSLPRPWTSGSPQGLGELQGVSAGRTDNVDWIQVIDLG